MSAISEASSDTSNLNIIINEENNDLPSSKTLTVENNDLPSSKTLTADKKLKDFIKENNKCMKKVETIAENQLKINELKERINELKEELRHKLIRQIGDITLVAQHTPLNNALKTLQDLKKENEEILSKKKVVEGPATKGQFWLKEGDIAQIRIIEKL